MAPQRRPGSVLLGAALALGVVAVLAATGGAFASHDPAANYTVAPHDQSDRQPGAENTSYTHYFEVAPPGDGNEGYNRTGYFTVAYDEGAFDQCSTADIQRFGVDRGNDDPRRQTDDRLFEHVESLYFGERYIRFNFYEGDELAAPEDAPLELDAGDQVVLTTVDCVRNPEDPGWYQTWGSINGTTDAGDHGASRLQSHYFYICDCEDEEAAREYLGPPPSEVGTPPASTPTATATVTPTATATVTPTPEPTPTPTATPVGGGQPPELPPLPPLPDLPVPGGLPFGALGLAGIVLLRRR